MTGTPPGLTSRIVESADAFEAIERGFPNHRYILVEHPLSSARPEGIRQRAEQALPEVLSIVFGHAAGDRWPRMLPAEGGSRGHHLEHLLQVAGDPAVPPKGHCVHRPRPGHQPAGVAAAVGAAYLLVP